MQGAYVELNCGVEREDVPLEVVAEQLGHASIRVTKDVNGHLMPGSRAKAAEAMREVLFDARPKENSPSICETVHQRPRETDALAVNLAVTQALRKSHKSVTCTFVGRPGLDPGTLGGTISGPSKSLEVCLSWSEDSSSPPTSASNSLNLLLRLSSWLSVEGFEIEEMRLL